MSIENGWCVYRKLRGKPGTLVAVFRMQSDAEEYAEEFIEGDSTKSVVQFEGGIDDDEGPDWDTST